MRGAWWAVVLVGCGGSSVATSEGPPPRGRAPSDPIAVADAAIEHSYLPPPAKVDASVLDAPPDVVVPAHDSGHDASKPPPPPKDAGPALGNACVVYLGVMQYQVSVAPACPVDYSVNYVPECATFGTCGCTSCSVIPDDPVQPCSEMYPGDITDPLSCAVGTACSVVTPYGLNAIPPGSVLSGTCAQVASPNEGA